MYIGRMICLIHYERHDFVALQVRLFKFYNIDEKQELDNIKFLSQSICFL